MCRYLRDSTLKPSHWADSLRPTPRMAPRSYQPPFQLTHRMAARMAEIAELLGAWKAVNHDALVPQLRRGHRIRTLHASLAIEQNTLTLDQMTAVLDGKTVLGSPREIQEVRNAFAAYEAMDRWQPHRLEDLLAAHRLLMAGLVDDAGRLRSGGVGVIAGDRVVHMAPPPSQVHRLVHDLLHWLQNTDAHPLIAGAAFHYEFEFIHPFSDGNGRLGRLWQTLILARWQPMLAYLPVETVIQRRQQAYYDQLGAADRQADCTGFIEFLLDAMKDSLQEAVDVEPAAEVTGEMTGKVTGEMTGRTPDAVLALLSRTPHLTVPELAARLDRSESTILRAIRKLRESGRLRRIGPDKGGHWEVPGS